MSICALVTSGSAFVTSALAQLDCTGRSFGETVYLALAADGSPLRPLLLALLTLFIAWFGLKLMFGRLPDASGVIMATLKVGLVLTLFASWPAVRTLLYQPLADGPAELLAQAGSPPLETQLQAIDTGLVAMTTLGTARNDIRVGLTAEGQSADAAFKGQALPDGLALGLGRALFLVSTLAGFGLIRLGGGLLIATLPIVAGLLLFERGQGVVTGWLRAMLAIFVLGLVIPLILGLETSWLGGWITQIIAARTQTLATPSAPIELLAMAASFAAMIVGVAAVVMRACFNADVPGVVVHLERKVERYREELRSKIATASQVRTQLISSRQTSSEVGNQLLVIDRLSHQRFAATPSGSEPAGPTGSRRLSPSRTRSRQRHSLSATRRAQR